MILKLVMMMMMMMMMRLDVKAHVNEQNDDDVIVRDGVRDFSK